MSEQVRNLLLAILVAVLVFGVSWYGYQRLYGRYHQTEPPSNEPPRPQVERSLAAWQRA